MTWLAETAMLSHGWRRFLLVLLAGAISALSVPPLFILPALFVGLPILVWSLDGAERLPGIRRLFGPAFTIGFGFGLGYFIVALHWLGAAFIQQGGIFLLLMGPAVVALAGLLALFWGAATACAHLLWSDGWVRLVTLATFLAAAEWLRGHVLSGFPFDLVGYALTANDEMMQLASVTGIYGLTLIALLIAATPALIWPADGRRLVTRLTPFFLAMGVLALQVGYGSYRLTTTEVTDRTDMRVRLVQPLILEHAGWAVAEPSAILDRLISLSETRLTPDDPGLSGVTHLIWPESVFPFFLTNYPDALARIARMLPSGTTLITGAPREPLEPDGLPIPDNPGYNSILTINTDGEIIASYDKSHLVPFGEYLPLAEFWRLFGIRQFVPGTNGWAPGDGRRLQAPPGMPPFLALVCYEAIFPGDIGDVSGAEFIVNVTNDAWFDGSIGPSQHAHHARLRSVETGLPLLRASNSGTTIVTDPLGRITARLAEQEMALVDVVPAHRLAADTFYTDWGDLPFAGALLGGLLLSILGRRRKARLQA